MNVYTSISNDINDLFKENNLSDMKSLSKRNDNSESLKTINSEIMPDSLSMNIKSPSKDFNPEQSKILTNKESISLSSCDMNSKEIIENSSLKNISNIAEISEDLDFQSFLDIFDNKEDKNKEIKNKVSEAITKGFLPFFVRINGYNPLFFLSKEKIKINMIINEAKYRLKVEKNIEDKFYYDNKLIDFDKTIKELNIKIFGIIHN